MRIQLVQWALGMMTSLQPVAVTPWADTYVSSAEAMVDVAEEAPLFKGEDGVRKTIVLLISLGWFEGRFNQKAIGDKGQSVCMFQLGVANLKSLGTSREEVLSDFSVCARSALKAVRISFNVCRGRDELDLLGHYASGSARCDAGLRESRHRMQKAKWLFGKFPFKMEDDNG